MKRDRAILKIPAFLLISLCFVISGATAIYASEVITLKFNERTEIKKDHILLGDICEVRGLDDKRIHKVKAIVLGSVLLAGQTKNINENYILLQLKKNDIDLTKINLQISGETTVIRSSKEISSDEIVRIVKDFLIQNITENPDNYKIRHITVKENVVLPGGNISYQVMLPKNEKLSGKTTLAVNLLSNGKIIKKVWAIADISIYMDVVMTRRPLGRYKLITDEDIHLLKQDLSKLPYNIITNCDDVIGKRTRRTVDANTVLRPDFVELPPLVKRGSIVSIIAESDNLKVSTIGKVKERGRLGQIIEVENLNSRKIIYARVLDANNVIVDF